MDMHSHLDLYENPFEVAKQCIEKDIYVLSVTTTPSAFTGTKNLESGDNRIRTALGLHPQVAHERYHELDLFDRLFHETPYIGEIGLDGSKGFKEHWQIQLKVFRHILSRVSEEGGRVMSIHTRNSAPAVLDELELAKGKPILHWFTGSQRDLKRAIKRDCWFSVGPAMLSTQKGKELLMNMPKNRVLTETDGPFAKFGRKMLYPWDFSIAIQQLSSLWNMPEIETSNLLKNNLRELLL